MEININNQDYEVDHRVRVENVKLLLRRNENVNQPVQCIHEK